MVGRYQMGKWNRGGFDGLVDTDYKWMGLDGVDGLLRWWWSILLHFWEDFF